MYFCLLLFVVYIIFSSYLLVVYSFLSSNLFELISFYRVHTIVVYSSLPISLFQSFLEYLLFQYHLSNYFCCKPICRLRLLCPLFLFIVDIFLSTTYSHFIVYILLFLTPFCLFFVSNVLLHITILINLFVVYICFVLFFFYR